MKYKEMKQLFVKDLTEQTRIDEIFLVKTKNLLFAKNGEPYLNLVLTDRTSDIAARIWDNVISLSKRFEKDDFIRIHAKCIKYQDKLQVVISEVEKVDIDKIDISDFIPTTDKNIDAMLIDLKKIILGVGNKFIRILLLKFFEDPEFIEKFKKAPAAKGIHHVFLGGLLEHTLSLCKLISIVAKHYDFIDKDLALAGGFLHDMGKIHELSYIRSFDYTDKGKLLGHISIGFEMLHEKIKEIKGFPTDLEMILKHMILSHHGYYEFGSPKRPKTLEAIMLHYLDDLDSKLNGIRAHIKNENIETNQWTSYIKHLDRYIFYLEHKRDDLKGEEQEDDNQKETLSLNLKSS